LHIFGVAGEARLQWSGNWNPRKLDFTGRWITH